MFLRLRMSTQLWKLDIHQLGVLPCRKLERTSATAELNPSVGGLGRTSYSNPLGRTSIHRPSADQLEKASIVYIKH